MLATADDFVLGHLADALRNLPGDSSKLTVLLSIHDSLQRHIKASEDANKANVTAQDGNASPKTLLGRIDNLRTEAVELHREGRVDEALSSMRKMKQIEHTLAYRRAPRIVNAGGNFDPGVVVPGTTARPISRGGGALHIAPRLAACDIDASLISTQTAPPLMPRLASSMPTTARSPQPDHSLLTSELATPPPAPSA